MIEYRDLRADELPLLGSVDRSELIDGFYSVRSGELVLAAVQEDVPPWGAAQLAAYGARLRALMDAGGKVVAAWDGERLVGFASLDVSGVGGDARVLKLDMLYVSCESRGRGIGRELTGRAADLARSLGAAVLYVSATPTRGTVDAYLRMGATLAPVPDPVLFAEEPEDIHLLLPLVVPRAGLG